MPPFLFIKVMIAKSLFAKIPASKSLLINDHHSDQGVKNGKRI